MAWAVAWSLLTLGVGCASVDPPPIPRHVGPSGEPSAKLVMRGAVEAGQSYRIFVLDDTDQCLRPRLAGTGFASRTPATTTLTAHQPATLEFQLTNSAGEVCSVIWTFTPAAAKTYLLAGESHRSGCAARLTDMTDADDMKLVASALRRNPSGQRCLPLARSLRAEPAIESGALGTEGVLRRGAKNDDLKGLITP